MKKICNQEEGITLVVLVITIIILIILAGVSMNAIIGDNGIIKQTKQQKENIEIQQREEQIKLNELKETLGSEAEQGTEKDIIEQLEKTTVTEEKMLKGYTAYSGGQLITGTMTNNGAVSSTLNCGASYTIPEGYHNGSGKVTANSLASQTSATATAADILSGKTAWVNGTKITGTNSGSNLEYITVTFPVNASWVTSKSVTITSLYSDYENLTIDNLIPVFVTYPSIRNSDAENAFRVEYTFSYTASTGTFTMSCNTEIRTYTAASLKLYIVE